jgi:hypothetical protein
MPLPRRIGQFVPGAGDSGQTVCGRLGIAITLSHLQWATGAWEGVRPDWEERKMIARKLLLGAVMLGLGAIFTFGLAVAMQQHATVDAPSYQPGAPPAVAADKRSDQEWMF